MCHDYIQQIVSSIKAVKKEILREKQALFETVTHRERQYKIWKYTSSNYQLKCFSLFPVMNNTNGKISILITL